MKPADMLRVRLHPLRLTFSDRQLEDIFTEQHQRRANVYVHQSAWLVIILTLVTVPLDWLTVGDIFFRYVALKLGVLVPICAIIIVATRRELSLYAFQWLGVLFAIGFAIGCMVPISLMAQPPLVLVGSWALVVPALLASFVHLFPAVALVSGIYLSTIVLAVTLAGVVLPLVLSTAVISTMVYVTLLFMAYQAERARRQAFLTGLASEELLRNILPDVIAERLKTQGEPVADTFREVTVIFADIVGFTRLASQRKAESLVELLNRIFSDFDVICERHGLEKIKTIGDAYMAVAGLPSPREDHADAACAMALDMLEAMRIAAERESEPLEVRIGIHSGDVVAGVIGQKKFIYDIWGDVVNIASRMESHGEARRIQVSKRTRTLLSKRFAVEERGSISLKNHTEMVTYWLVGYSTAAERTVTS